MSETKEKIFLIDTNSEYAQEVKTLSEAEAQLNDWVKEQAESEGTKGLITEGKIFVIKGIPIFPTPSKFQFKEKE